MTIVIRYMGHVCLTRFVSLAMLGCIARKAEDCVRTSLEALRKRGIHG